MREAVSVGHNINKDKRVESCQKTKRYILTHPRVHLPPPPRCVRAAWPAVGAESGDRTFTIVDLRLEYEKTAECDS